MILAAILSGRAAARRRGAVLCTHCHRLWSSQSKLGEGAEELFMPPTFSRMEVPDQAPIVQGYTTNGFIVAGSRVFGSVALLPRGILHWKVSRVGEITPESFTLFHLVEPKLELIVLGTGSQVHRIDQSIIDYLIRKGISLEVQDTPHACATFNYFLDEGRPAGAALIPPEYIPP